MDRRRFLRQAALAGASALIPRKARAQAAARHITLLLSTAPPNPTQHCYFYARENGFYAQEGVDVEIQSFIADPTCLRALISDAGDVATCGAVSSLAAMNSGAKLTCISAMVSRSDSLIVANRAVADLKALSGRSIAVASMGGGTQIAAQIMAEQEGVSPSSIHWATLGGAPTRLQALIDKRVDAGLLDSGFATTALGHDYLHTIGDVFKSLPLLVLSWEATTPRVLASKPDALRGLVTATIRGARWGMDNPAQAAAISRTILPDAAPQEMRDFTAHFAAERYWNENGELSRAAWNFTCAAMVRMGLIPAIVPYEQVYAPQFVDAALAKLGRV